MKQSIIFNEIPSTTHSEVIRDEGWNIIYILGERRLEYGMSFIFWVRERAQKWVEDGLNLFIVLGYELWASIPEFNTVVNILARNAFYVPARKFVESYFCHVFRGIFLRFVE